MKSWKFSMARSVTLSALLELVTNQLAKKRHATAITSADGQILYVRPNCASDVATLPQAAVLCHKYLRLAPGDVAIVNDPSSGGTRLSEVTLVTASELSGLNVLIASRFTIPARWGEKGTISEEGVRIPPTPLAHAGKINSDLLTAISSHPLAPTGFAKLVEDSVSELLESARKLSLIAKEKGTELTKDGIASYLRDTSKAFENLMHKLPLGAAEVSSRIPSGEIVKLRLEMSENKLHFDFKGTENSARYAITELTTLSSCIWSVLSLVGEKIPLNSGLFEHFQVVAPSGTMLDLKGQAGTERGINAIVPALCNLIIAAFSKLNPALKSAECSGGYARLLVEADHTRALFSAACGSRATSKEAGEDACVLWAPAASNDSGDELVSWIMRGLNPKSGGAGKLSGGNGELLHFKILKPAKLRWDLTAGSLKSAGASHGKAGEPAKLTIARNGENEKPVREHEGSIDLAPGDEVKLLGAGGGGYGEPSASTSAE
jgi:N-methylhydantoinase B